ncbi:MAG TPA: hypothetical protein VJ508_02410, partial [Saprospiraceae bacterium]|nr:hypothetical protein [Saprospiraceae bacterium]
MSTEENKYETLIQGLLGDGFGMMDDFLEADLVAQLRNRLLSHLSTGEMKQAGIGQLQHFQQNPDIRRDLIYWIDPEHTDGTEQYLLNSFWAF